MATTYEDTFLYWLRQRPAGSLSPQEVTHFIRQAADTLQLLHNHHAVHGRVSPACFVLRPGIGLSNLPDLQLVALDETPSSEKASSAGFSVDLPSSMAPEQWSGETIPASDQYALAVMAYQLLTWKFPFQGSQEELRYQHLHEQPRPPSLFNSRIPQTLDAVILRALAKNPADRYPNITVFAEAFQQALQPQQLSQPSTTSQLPDSASPAYLQSVAGATHSTPANRPARFPLRESLILSLVFLVVVSGIGFGFYKIINSNRIAAGNSATATSSVQNPTATAIATVNASPTTVTSGTPLFTDSLASNDGGWAANSNCVFTGGTYHALQSQADKASICALEMEVKGNVAIQVDVSLLAGNEAGIDFRIHSTGNQLQWIDCSITGQGAFLCVHFMGTALHVLIPLTKNPAIHTGSQKNTMLVVPQGSDFKIYINSAFVGEAQDSASTSWLVALIVRTSPSNPQGDASFSNFKLYTLT
jgi:eukaryotic-like serine/threonine-protein kinase